MKVVSEVNECEWDCVWCGVMECESVDVCEVEVVLLRWRDAFEREVEAFKETNREFRKEVVCVKIMG